MTQLLAGKIGKPHGTSGEVYVERISDDPARFAPGAELIHEDGRVLRVTATREHRDRFLVRFEGIDDRDSATAARGALYVSATDLRDLEEGEFWLHELVGCEVHLSSGGIAGTVTGVIPHPAQAHLEVSTEAGTRLVPLVPAIVTSVETDARRIVIDPPEGLL